MQATNAYNPFQLECLAVNFCNKVTGSTLKMLLQRSKRLTCLLMNGTSKLSVVETVKFIKNDRRH